MGALTLDKALLKKASDFLNVLDNQIRWGMIKAIHHKGSMTVTELYIHLRIEQTQTSQYLRTLREAGFVTTTRNGKYIYCSLNYEKLEKAGGIINGFLNQNPPDYILNYKTYVQTLIPYFKPAAYVETYNGIEAWLSSFSQKLKAYNAAIGEKKKELLKEAKKDGNTDFEILKEALERIRTEGIKAFIKEYKP